jgi:hypothetical protein
MLANLALKEVEGEDIARFSPRARAAGPDLSGANPLPVRWTARSSGEGLATNATSYRSA